jgi:hypothetical protein
MCGAGSLRVMKTWDDEDCYPERERVTVCQRRYCPSCDPAYARPIYTRYYRDKRQIFGIMPKT